MNTLASAMSHAERPNYPNKGGRMTWRFIDWIWHVRGSVALPPGQSADEAFDALDPLFRETGTTRERAHDRLSFRKKDPAAQDKLSIFDGGVLQVARDADGPVLRYHMTSRALLFCFLAPLLFLGVAQLTIAIGKWEKASADPAAAAKKAEKEKPLVQLNPIDKFLGAPAPEKPKKDAKDKADDKKGPSPTPAYVFAGIFAALYVVGRILEDWLVRRLFARWLSGG